jgi:CubicO group peptidase (beta-lactamase class C family)
MRRRSFLLGLPLAVACAAAPRAQTLRDDRRRRRVPGVAIAHVRGGHVELAADGDLAADELCEVCSLSKPVFAYAVIAAAARGVLDLDAPIARIAPPPYRHVRRGAVDELADPRLARVTPRLLLSHRAGLPNWARDRPLAFEREPGAAWAYSGEGYVLLQRALEAAGHPLDAFVREHALAPLGMDRSTYDPARAGRRAQGHDRDGAPEETSVDAPIAATSLLSTAAEYARFAARLATAPPHDPIVDAMLAPQVEVDADRRLAWGTGVALAAPGWFFHWGVNPGFRALVVGARGRGEAIVVLTDGDGGMELAADVVRDRFGDLPLLTFPLLYPPD